MKRLETTDAPAPPAGRRICTTATDAWLDILLYGDAYTDRSVSDRLQEVADLMDGQTPEDAMREGITALLGRHTMEFGGTCSCGVDVHGLWDGWNRHIATAIIAEFPPATLEVTDYQSKIDELTASMLEWAEGRRGIQTEDPARDSVQEAMEVVKKAAAVFGLAVQGG